eukprot:scaffold1475_cov167-Amphora_coffeaeformis.AAC.13
MANTDQRSTQTKPHTRVALFRSTRQRGFAFLLPRDVSLMTRYLALFVTRWKVVMSVPPSLPRLDVSHLCCQKLLRILIIGDCIRRLRKVTKMGTVFVVAQQHCLSSSVHAFPRRK